MTFFDSVVMGVVQGLTEFLPVSSSGHLALFRELLGVGLAEDVGFEVAVHTGTLIAVLIYFRRQLLKLAVDIIRDTDDGRRWALYLIIATIPAGIVGLWIKDDVERLFNDLALVGAAWIFTAVVLLISERLSASKIEPGKMGSLRALFIGAAQAAAILPGVSRSGSTIAAGLLSGVERRGAVGFSFILSLPVIAGAIILTLKDWSAGAVSLGLPHLAGMTAALISGYAAIAWMLRIVSNRKLFWFAIYCFILGAGTLIYTFGK
ncbi:MAG: undecaprenyl-diphosphate phosphatase [Calditrichaeota bacterium]|nr:undecaprenyl-diphosphate phosphatase [Calditrichota bacterium]